MRILHVFDHSLPLHSGYTFRSANILRQQRTFGWQTLQLTSPRQRGGDALEEDAEGLHFHRTPAATPSGWRLPVVGAYVDEMRATERRIEQLVGEFAPDILHAHSPLLNAFPALSVGRRYGLPVVYEVRACWEDAAVDHGSTHEGSLRYRATRAAETHAVRRADAVTVICEGLRKEFEGRGIPGEKITVIPNAVDIHGFQPSTGGDAQFRAKLGLDNATVLGFVGSFYAYEGLDLLLDAMPALLKAIPALRVLLVGGGPQEAALKEQAARLGVASQATFIGRVPHDQVQHYYDLIDILVYARHSMRLTDLVTPLKPLEAMAQGRILVASDVGGHRELIRDADTGYLFEAGKPAALVAAVQRALGERHLWPAMGQRGRQFVEAERSWAASVERYRPVYESLLRLRPSATRRQVTQG